MLKIKLYSLPNKQKGETRKILVDPLFPGFLISVHPIKLSSKLKVCPHKQSSKQDIVHSLAVILSPEYILYSLFGSMYLKRQFLFSAFCFANVLENTSVYLSWQQLEKELCKDLEGRCGGTEQLRKTLFPQRRVHQLIFKYETLRGRQLSLEEWRKLFKRLDLEREFLAIVQKFKIGKNPRNFKTRKVWKVCKSYSRRT